MDLEGLALLSSQPMATRFHSQPHSLLPARREVERVLSKAISQFLLVVFAVTVWHMVHSARLGKCHFCDRAAFAVFTT